MDLTHWGLFNEKESLFITLSIVMCYNDGVWWFVGDCWVVVWVLSVMISFTSENWRAAVNWWTGPMWLNESTCMIDYHLVYWNVSHWWCVSVFRWLKCSGVSVFNGDSSQTREIEELQCSAKFTNCGQMCSHKCVCFTLSIEMCHNDGVWWC